MDAANTPTSNDPSETKEPSAIYKNHPLGSNETRVVQIMPSTSVTESDLISLRLSVISLGDMIPTHRVHMSPFELLPYLAVSYMWGDPALTKDILVDGKLFAIRLNIWDFLLQMRKEQCQDSLWIDSICINQDDLAERGHQVALMGQVYSKATEVRVWLGAGTEENWLGMQRLSETDWHKFRYGGLCRQDSSDITWHPFDCSICNVLPPSMSTEQFLAPVVELCELEYWSRMWIVQEFLLAQQLKIQCGSFSTDADTVDQFHWCYQSLLQNSQEFREFQELQDESKMRLTIIPREYFGKPNAFRLLQLREFYLLRHLFYSGSFADFRELVEILHCHRSLDPRDHIYAILSLNQWASENIVPDYTKSAQKLFLEVVELLNFRFREYNGIGRGGVESLQRALQLSDDCHEVRSALAAAGLEGKGHKTLS